MGNVTDLFKGQKINKLKTGAITSHINHLIKSDPDFKEKFKADPIGIMQQFGLSRKESSALMVATINIAQNTGLAAWTSCCCTNSITNGKIENQDLWSTLPAITDTKAWSKLALGK